MEIASEEVPGGVASEMRLQAGGAVMDETQTGETQTAEAEADEAGRGEARTDEAGPDGVGADGAGVDGEPVAAFRVTEGGRRIYSEATWAKAEKDYFDGMSARKVSARYGMSQQAIYTRMSLRGKRARAGVGVVAPAPVDPLAALFRELFGKLLALLPPPVRWEFAEFLRGLLAAPGQAGRPRRAGRRDRYMHHDAEVWKAARRDYEEGDFTAPAIAERYGLNANTIHSRAASEGWAKRTFTEVAPPLHPLPDPAQVDALGEPRWPEGAHAAQLPPEGAWATWLFQGGRGAGKTRAGAEWIAALAEATPGGRFALVAATEHDLREVMIEGPSGLRALPGRETPRYEVTRRKLKWKNGAVAYGFSAEQPERLRGPQFMAAWVDEFCAWRKPDKVLENLRLGLRMGDDPRLVVTTTPKPIRAMRNLVAEASCVVTQAATAANAANLAQRFLSGIEQLYGGTTLAEQEIMGVLVEGEGSLWKAAELARCRGARPPRLERVVVGLDPPAGTDGSACGIVVAGRLDDRGYVLADRSMAGLSPLGWGRRVKEAVEEFGAVRVIAEKNQGGDMVKQTLLTAGVTCAIDLVHAGRSKRARAEPVYAYYEQGRVTHCGEFGALEQELMAISGVDADEEGLDRADALVWALLKLLPPPRLGRPHVWRA